MTTVNLDSSALTSALEQLRLKLLDLTGRNRLINFKLNRPGFGGGPNS